MVKNTIILVSLTLILITSSVIAENNKTILAVVNGTEISSENYLDNSGKLDLSTLKGKKKKQIVDLLINQQLLLDQIHKEGFDQSEQITKMVKLVTESYITKQYLVKLVSEFDLGKDVIMTHYESKYLNQPKTVKYKVKHILFATEEEASSILGQINNGADFLENAKTKSKDKVSSEKGGELGWLTSEDMSPSFFKTVSKLSNGEISAQLTKTQFGWHIISLDDKRELSPPAFSNVEKRIRQEIIKVKLNDYFNDLRSNAEIEVK
ncbi:MAG: peptidylprolyl isomerase [gamma proteobacterium symbiont of Taylorina sp.]|nr:peptidylprolyl isomerase [gamma proteobacterium symbiont of Taylorina sp.]